MKRLSVKKIILLFITCICAIGAAACQRAGEQDEELKDNEYLVYYLDGTGCALAAEKYQAAAAADDTEALIEELYYAMAHPSNVNEYSKTVRDQIVCLESSLNNEVLYVNFAESYATLSTENEVMFRAAYVKTMTQIQGVKYICFYVNDQPLMDALGNLVGIMLASDFMEDIGSGTYRTWVDLSVYYGSTQADRLSPEKITVGYGKNASIERVIIEQLIKGPGEEGHVRTVPASLTLLGVSTKDGTCYVNFDSSLTDIVVSVPPAVTIYSIVNSLCELSNVNKVQISINSNSNVVFRDVIDLSQPLERSLDIIETQ